MSIAQSPAANSRPESVMERTRIGTALLSAYDKSGIVELARGLVRGGAKLLASGGTARVLRQAGLDVRSIEDYTGLAPGFGGRVKTLHPLVHAGILARRDVREDMAELARAGGTPIDLVYVNLYPFEETVAAGAPENERIEQIDIGGPALLRAAAKNWQAVTVLCDPSDIATVLDELGDAGATSSSLRRRLAAKVFARTSAYDHAIAADLAASGGESPTDATATLPERVELSLRRVAALRYGENPDQQAALYAAAETTGELPGGWRQVSGIELSYNNWVDMAAAATLAGAFTEPAAVIVKHTNPCGVALAADGAAAWDRALASDPVSAFGGIAAFNVEVGKEIATRVKAHFLEVVVAPAFTDAALDLLAKKKRLRLVRTPSGSVAVPAREWRILPGDVWLAQSGLRIASDPAAWTQVSERAPTEAERRDLAFAWTVVAHVKSNAIVFAKDRQVLGVGAGQMSRVDSVRIAIDKAHELGHDLRGSVLASDAFFPFADGPQLALAAGATAIVQPGGSKRDDETIAAVKEGGAAMLFTGRRVFRH
jgi:phosphoribosylaminoimidazolecarboxamide formyltransferase/IMP cyclohydrolase